MTQTTNHFRPHSITFWVDTETIAPITKYGQDHDLPFGTVARIVISGVIGNEDLQNLAIEQATTARRMSLRKMCGAMLDDETLQTIDSLGRQNGVKRAAVVRAALVVGSKHLPAFSSALETERVARRAAHERGRERMIKMVTRFQGEVAA